MGGANEGVGYATRACRSGYRVSERESSVNDETCCIRTHTHNVFPLFMKFWGPPKEGDGGHLTFPNWLEHTFFYMIG